MTQISTTPESVAIGDEVSGEPASRVRPQALDAVASVLDEWLTQRQSFGGF